MGRALGSQMLLSAKLIGIHKYIHLWWMRSDSLACFDYELGTSCAASWVLRAVGWGESEN